jgi:DNA polymerase I-like protein with 3'-5' exonuclease and polymerase domains/predicted P-loop ATPase
MDIADITIESVAKAVGGTIERKGEILCCCPIHEASGTHNPSLVLTITGEKRVIFHCRSQRCDDKHAHAIHDHLIKCGLPRSHVGGSKVPPEVRYTYQHPDGRYAWTKTRYFTKSGKKRYRCEVYNETAKEWSLGRPDGMPLLFNLAVIGQALTMDPTPPLMIVEGEKDALTAGSFGVLATTNADGAGKWRIEDTAKLIELGARKIVVCPDNDAPGIAHGIHVAKTFQQAGIEVYWLELPGLGPKEDISDWAPKQAQPDALLAELIGAAPPFDADALDWRGRLKMARTSADHTYRGDIYNISLALRYEPRLKGCFAYNDFRHRVEVIAKTPWCSFEWWEAASLTPAGYRALRDADIAALGNYLTEAYDFGACAMTSSRHAIHATADYRIFDELKDWIDTLPEWDSVHRLDSWLITYAGADTGIHSDEYLALIGAKYIMQVLHRALNPGTKADYSLVFTAPQGFSKDRTLEAMFAPYYREGIPSPGRSPADFARGIAGAIVAHAAEMSAWRKADVEEQKAALTRCVDTDRPAYGHEVRSYPRRTCLAFSTNDVEFLQDATGNRRYWPVSTIRELVNIEGLRRDRDQLLAEALVRLASGEQHWPTPEEEWRLIVPEQQKFVSEAALEIVAILERFIDEEPQTTRPNREDFAWKWERRPQPLRELYLDAFFRQCFGMYAAVRRQGLDRASKKDISYCTTWLRENGWRRVQKRLLDGQRVRVWRVSDREQDPQVGTPRTSSFSVPEAEEALQDQDETSMTGVADTNTTGSCSLVKALGTPQNHHGGDVTPPKNSKKTPPVIHLAGNDLRHTQTCLSEQIRSQILSADAPYKIYPGESLREIDLGVPSFEGGGGVASEWLEERFSRDRFLALDVETTGLHAACDGLRTVQFSDGENAALMVFDRPVSARALVVLADFLQGRRVVAHNARFEVSWLREAGIDLVLDDTVLLFSAVRGTRSLHGGKLIGGGGGRVSLAMLAAMVLDETLDKSEQVSDWAASELSPSQLTYAINDAIVTHRIWEALRAELHRKSKQCGVDIAAGYEDMRFSAAMAHSMERAGIGFDVEAHQAWVIRKQEPVTAIEAYLVTLDAALSPACIASGVQLDKLFRRRLEAYPARDQRQALLKWPRTQKTRRLAFGREDLAVVVLAKCLPPSELELVEALYARAEQARFLSVFGTAFSDRVIDGRLHGQLHAGGAVTGRYVSTDPNLQNIPTDPEFRGFFRASEGRLLVDVDYSQLELRVFAAISGDAKMIQAFEDGWDYHDLIVKRVGCTRRQAKAINFGIIFGMSVSTLAAELGVDDVTAGEYLRQWDEQAPAGAEWRASLPHLYAAEQGVRTARRWIDYLDDDEADISASTRPKNYPVQGGAADVMHRSMRLLFERYRSWPGNVKPVLTVHDEILVEADANHADQVGQLLAGTMIDAFRDVLSNGPTRFLAVPGIGSTWAAAKADGEKREKALRQAI